MLFIFSLNIFVLKMTLDSSAESGLWCVGKCLTRSTATWVSESCTVFNYKDSNLKKKTLFHCARQDLAVACRLLVAVCGIQFSGQGSNQGPLHWEHRLLATGPAEKSHHHPRPLFFLILLTYQDWAFKDFLDHYKITAGREREDVEIKQRWLNWNSLCLVLVSTRREIFDVISLEPRGCFIRSAEAWQKQ